MNRLIFLFFIVLLCCKEENTHVQIIPNYDEIYLAEELVDITARPKDSDFNELFNQDLKAITHELYDKEKTDLPMQFSFNYWIYIEENGEINKIKRFTPSNIDYADEDAIFFKDKELIDRKFSSVAKTWDIIPARKNGKNVKSRKKIEGTLYVDQQGIIKVYIPILTDKKDFMDDYNFLFNEGDYPVEVDEMAKPIGGIEAIAKLVKYPAEAKKKGIEGKVFVKALVNENGSVDYVKLVKGIGHGCDDTAIKAVKQVKFIPAKHKGKETKVQIVIPILFKLQ